MNNDKISIIVPVYKTEKYLPKCLDSIINQTYKNIEIICVNDASPDRSIDILNEYEKKDNRIIVISKENEGVSIARNTALDIATGDYIMFVDSDDWIDENTCKVSIDAASSYDADVVMWDYIREFSNKSAPKNIYDKDIIFEKKDVIEKLHRRMIGIVGEELSQPENADALCTIWGKLYKRESIYHNNIRFYDIRRIGTYEDGLFNLEIFENVNRAVYLHKFMYHYRKDNEGSITTKYKDDLIEKHEQVLDFMDKYIKDKNLSCDYKKALNNRTALELVGYGLNILSSPDNHIKKIRKVITNERYINSYKKLEFEYLPLHWKAFYGCAKYKCAVGVYLMLLFINKKIRR